MFSILCCVHSGAHFILKELEEKTQMQPAAKARRDEVDRGTQARYKKVRLSDIE